MNTLQKITELLISQIGYTETGTNITKYAKYFDTPKSEGGAWQFLNTKKQGSQWCALLILWAFCQILGTDETRKFLGLPKPADNCAAGCKFFYEYLEKKGYKVAKSKGQTGGIIFFNTKSAECGHVGYIEKVDDKKYYTIEGNKGNQVKRCSYAKTNANIYAICMPDYSKLDSIKDEPKEDPKEEPTKPVEPAKNLYKVKTFTGKSLNLRKKPNTNCEIITTMKQGSIIEVIEIKNGWAKVCYNNKTGYCTANRITKA